MRDVLVIGFMIAAVIILLRIILGSPLITRIRESFANEESLVSTGTECPPDMTFVMHDGRAFCHTGDFASFSRALSKGDKSVSYCALGPGSKGVESCGSLLADFMRTKGSAVCPKDKPNYVKGPVGERCCAGPTNPVHTECMGGDFCPVSADTNEFADEKSCQFQKAQQSAECPSGYNSFVSQGTNMKLLGCTNGAANCYAKSTLKRLGELGYDTTGLPSCS
jgi:hypothetical protein